jgi:DNA-binding winged helix-turn-helix (wHTH) protein
MPEAGVYEFGPFRLDAEKAVLWRGSELVPLTPKALALLCALVEHAGDVVPKRDLMRRVWPDVVVSDANLTVTVATLRKALGPQPDGRSYVQSVPRRGYRFDAALRGAPAQQRLALAVLPFSELGPEAEAQLGLPLADALIGRLTAFEELSVLPTAAVAAHAGTVRSPRELAHELGVDAVVTGTVQRDAGRLRVSAQLTPRPASLRSWAESFDADWTSLFAVQDAIAERIAGALWPRLAPAGRPGRGPRHAPAPEAHEAYLRGRYFWMRLDPEGVAKAIGCFAEAAALDPAWAAPHAGLADAHVVLGFGGAMRPREAWALAEDCVAEALSRDPALAEAHVSSGLLALYRDWDWAQARLRLERAASLSPGAAAPLQWKSLVLGLGGALEAAQREQALARAADPLSGVALALEAFLHGLAGASGPQLTAARRAVQMRGERALSHFCLGLACARSGRLEEAVAALSRAVELSDGGTIMRCLLAWALARSGGTREARLQLEELDAAAAGTYVSPYHRARVLAALGEPEQALERLEQAAADRDAWVVFLGVDEGLAELRALPGYVSLAGTVLPRR